MTIPRPKINTQARAPPFIELSDGSATSKTAPLAPLSSDIAPAERARLRFGVRGNAIITGGGGNIGFVACRALLEHGLQGLVQVNMTSFTENEHGLSVRDPLQE